MKNIIVLLTFLVPAFSFAVTEPVACTMDAKLCPDGVTYVGRVGPSCAFAACPGETKPLPPFCTNLKFDLDIGSTDTSAQGEVSVIQNFLYPQYLKVKPTGAFYGLTRAAVVQFQKDNGIFPARGYVGALTRAKIKELICNGGVVSTPTISTLDPKTAKVGETVTLTGLGLNTGGDYVLFGGYRIETHAIKAANRISFTVPETISKTIYCITTPCPQPAPEKVLPGAYSIQVINNIGKSNTVVLTVIDGTVVVPPVNDKISISFVEPSAAKVGASVVIYGYNLFRSETRILLDGYSIKGQPVYTKRLGDFNSALEFTVPSYLSSCTGFFCLASLGRKVTPGTYELAVDNKYGRDVVKFEVLGDVIGGKPYLTYSNPTQGIVGTEVFVFGQNINTGSEKIYFGGSQVPSTSLATDRRGMVRFKIPEYITPCGYEDGVMCRMMAQQVVPGKYDIVVKNKDGLSNTVSFTVVAISTNPKPEITSLAPSTGSIGTEVAIRGTGLSGTDNKIYFGGSLVSSTYAASSTTSADIVVTVPFFRVPAYITPCGVGNENFCKIASIPVTPGKYDVVVVNKNGVSNSLSFVVVSSTTNPKPEITSLSPSTGAVGTEVAIRGTGINSNSQIYFGGSLIFQPSPVSASTADIVVNMPWFRVPAYITPCGVGSNGLCRIASQPVVPGTYDVVVVQNGIASNVLKFNVTASSVGSVSISGISPSSGGTGSSVTLYGDGLSSSSDFVWFGGLKITPDRGIKAANVLVFTVPTTLFQCNTKPGEECLAVFQPTPLGTYEVKAETGTGIISNAVKYQVTSNGSSTDY
jgi:hypothetical protein